jgi:hypothetical protein
MSTRYEPPDSLDFFPTGPWGTRSLVERVIIPKLGRHLVHGLKVWECAAGEGHMAEVLREYFADVYASDVFDYGKGYAVGSFVGEGPDVAQCPFAPDWIITNPPFKASREFVLRALQVARIGVAMLVRGNWDEGAERYWSIFEPTPPAFEAVFVERLPMHRGRWEPDGETMTAYSWFVWLAPFDDPARDTLKIWIPPGQRSGLERPDDRRRFARHADGAPQLPL